MNRKTLAIVMTLVVAGPGSAWAQDTAAIKKALTRVAPGETISVLDTSGRSETGRLSGSTDASITLDGSRKVAANRIARVTVKDSTRNGTALGALIGGGAGVAGAIALGALCANEGGSCAEGTLLLIGLGVGAGAGIGWLGDSLTQHEIYRAGGMPRQFSPEVRVRLGLDKRAVSSPVAGLAWSGTSQSGLGVELNLDRTKGAGNGDGRGYSFDARALYAFGHGPFRPFVSGGAGFFHHYENYTVTVPSSAVVPNGLTYSGQASIDKLAPIVGGGLRIQAARHIVVRPELSWFPRPGNGPSGAKSNVRAGVSAGVAW